MEVVGVCLTPSLDLDPERSVGHSNVPGRAVELEEEGPHALRIRLRDGDEFDIQELARLPR